MPKRRSIISNGQSLSQNSILNQHFAYYHTNNGYHVVRFDGDSFALGSDFLTKDDCTNLNIYDILKILKRKKQLSTLKYIKARMKKLDIRQQIANCKGDYHAEDIPF